MRIHFTNGANSILDLLCELRVEKTGFIFGVDLGNRKIINNIVPLNFEESSIIHLYNMVYKKNGDSLLGVFFLNRTFFLSDCFFENIILTVQNGHKKVFQYGFDKSCSDKKCILVYSQ